MQDPTLEVQELLTAEERERFLHRVAGKFPGLRGAHVADALDIIGDSDAFVSVTEQFWDKYPELLKRDERDLAVCMLTTAIVLLERDDCMDAMLCVRCEFPVEDCRELSNMMGWVTKLLARHEKKGDT